MVRVCGFGVFSVFWCGVFLFHIPFSHSSVSCGSLGVDLQSATGDTIVSSKASAVAAARRAGRDAAGEKRSTSNVESLLLAGVEIPDPVFFCTIEPPSMAKQQGTMQLPSNITRYSTNEIFKHNHILICQEQSSSPIHAHLIDTSELHKFINQCSNKELWCFAQKLYFRVCLSVSFAITTSSSTSSNTFLVFVSRIVVVLNFEKRDGGTSISYCQAQFCCSRAGMLYIIS